MGVSSASYDIARSGLMVSERALNVTGHNISNVNTAGYVRQQAIISSSAYLTDGNFQFGLGADIQQIRQIRHSFLDNVYRQENTSLGYWESRNKTFEDVQAILGEPMGDGLQNVMNQFWDSWQELSKAPDSLTVRALVRQRGEALVHQVNHVGNQLNKLQTDLNSEIVVRIDEVNNITAKIAELNVGILRAEVSNDSANDYRDQRNSLVDRLSKLISADVTEMQDGQLAVTVGGYFVVTQGDYRKLYVDESKAGSHFYVPKLEGTNLEVPVKSGIIKGLMESRGEVSGAFGSVQNGTPYEKVDLVFAIDRNAAASKKSEIISNASAMVDDFKSKGIDVRLGYVEFDSSGFYSYNQGTASYDNTPSFTADLADFEDIVNNHIGAPAAGTPKGLEALTAIEGLNFDKASLKQVVLVTNSTLDTTTYDVANVASTLAGNGIHTSVIGPTGAAQIQLSPISTATGSSFFNIADYDAANPDALTGIEDGIYTEVKDDIYNNIFSTGNIVSDLRNQLNLLVNVMARELNSIHGAPGNKTLNGLQGGNFFDVINSALPMEMGNLKLSDDLKDLNNIVASRSGGNGDNTIALEIANLRHNTLIGKTNELVSIDDFYRSIILQVGNNGSAAEGIYQNQLKLVQSADDHRQAITGVSMDEEMTNLMKYKFAYDAASRAINVVDEMVSTIIEKMGLVGR